MPRSSKKAAITAAIAGSSSASGNPKSASTQRLPQVIVSSFSAGVLFSCCILTLGAQLGYWSVGASSFNASSQSTSVSHHVNVSQRIHSMRSHDVKSYTFPRFRELYNVFSASESQQLIEFGEKLGFTEGKLGSAHHATAAAASGDLRIAQIVGLPKHPQLRWAYARVIQAVHKANQEHWQFHLEPLMAQCNATVCDAIDSKLIEFMQLSKYVGSAAKGKGGHYAWHRDTGYKGVTARRRVSFTVQLSSSNAYSGGALEIKESSHAVPTSNKRGTATVFPSYTLHRVAAVTRGTRYSLVGWYEEAGPDPQCPTIKL